VKGKEERVKSVAVWDEKGTTGVQGGSEEFYALRKSMIDLSIAIGAALANVS
jgi:hypothetical protein